MGELSRLQRDFAAAILTARETLPAPLTRRAGGEPHRRFNVYRNNVYSSLIDVMQARFPVASLLVGDEFFRAMARVYIEQEPPRSAVLIRYGESFPSFVASFPPAQSVPYLADMAALEWAWHAAYHAADAAPLPLEELACVADHAGDAVLKLHPSLGLVRSAFPIVTIYELHAERAEPPQTKLEAQGEDALGAQARSRRRDQKTAGGRGDVHRNPRKLGTASERQMRPRCGALPISTWKLIFWG